MVAPGEPLPGNYISMEAALMGVDPTYGWNWRRDRQRELKHLMDDIFPIDHGDNVSKDKPVTGTSIHEALEATIKQSPTPGEAEQQIRDILTAAVDALVKISGVPTPALFYVGSDERIYRLDSEEEVHFAHAREAHLALGLLHAAEGAAQRAANRSKKPRGQSSTYPVHERAARRMLTRPVEGRSPVPEEVVKSYATEGDGTKDDPYAFWGENDQVPWTHKAYLSQVTGWVKGDYNPTARTFVWVDSRGDVVVTTKRGYVELTELL